MTTVTVKLCADLPDGFESANEMRVPSEGEWFYSVDSRTSKGVALKCVGAVLGPRLILRKIPTIVGRKLTWKLGKPVPFEYYTVVDPISPDWTPLCVYSCRSTNWCTDNVWVLRYEPIYDE